MTECAVMLEHPRLIHATWTLQGYFICSFQDKTILGIHPTGRRYWIKQWRNSESSNEWLGSIFCLPRHWKPYIQRAVPLRNNCTQCPIWFNRTSSSYEILQLQETVKKIEWPSKTQLGNYMLTNLTPLATILYSLHKEAALIVFRHEQLIQVCISPRALQNRDNSNDLEHWIRQHVQRFPSISTIVESQSNNNNDMIVQTFPISQCPFIFREALSLVSSNFDNVLHETTAQQELFPEHIYEPIPLDQLVQHTTEWEDNYQLDQRAVPFVQFDSDTFFWYATHGDFVIAWKIVRLDIILLLNNGGRIVEYFSFEDGRKHHFIYSIRGMSPEWSHSWGRIVQTSLRWRNRVKKLLIQPVARVSSSRKVTRKTRQEWLRLESWGDFKLDTEGYLSCHFRDGTFILFHPDQQLAFIVRRGDEYSIDWKQTRLFRRYFLQIHQIYEYLLLSPFERREIQNRWKIQQQRIAFHLRNADLHRQVLRRWSPPLLVISS
ncbi:hypothetical protein GpartN1_g6718.t1 [Galdieria partita]|uniref:Uncharacterized protein n=1 Tax=Galdieria partita TaxID=83374 RepID=A0A9C7Q3I2_9RHOD|nr:hypothetical protein GpartN1_g6718.t1 [Galdieria partita]